MTSFIYIFPPAVLLCGPWLLLVLVLCGPFLLLLTAIVVALAVAAVPAVAVASLLLLLRRRSRRVPAEASHVAIELRRAVA